jgi:cytochrome c-type biogenesis protein
MFEILGIGVIAAFLAGAISFVSPCVLPLVPGHVFYLAGYSAGAAGEFGNEGRRRKAVAMGAFFVLGMARISVMRRDLRFHFAIPGGRPAAAYVLGLAFGFGWTPCIGPILGVILAASAASATVSEGVALLGVYSAGLGVPFLLAAGFTDGLTRRLRAIGRTGRRLHQGAGVVMIAIGIMMMTGHLRHSRTGF